MVWLYPFFSCTEAVVPALAPAVDAADNNTEIETSNMVSKTLVSIHNDFLLLTCYYHKF